MMDPGPDVNAQSGAERDLENGADPTTGVSLDSSEPTALHANAPLIQDRGCSWGGDAQARGEKSIPAAPSLPGCEDIRSCNEGAVHGQGKMVRRLWAQNTHVSTAVPMDAWSCIFLDDDPCLDPLRRRSVSPCIDNRTLEQHVMANLRRSRAQAEVLGRLDLRSLSKWWAKERERERERARESERAREREREREIVFQ